MRARMRARNNKKTTRMLNKTERVERVFARLRLCDTIDTKNREMSRSRPRIQV